MAFLAASLAVRTGLARVIPARTIGLFAEKTSNTTYSLTYRLTSQAPTQDAETIGEDLMHPAQPESHLPKWPHNVAYVHYTEEQQKLYWDGITDNRANIIPRDRPGQEAAFGPKVDPEAEPFKQLYEEGSEIVSKSREVPDAWFWVQRLLPQPIPTLIVSESQEPLPSGWRPAPAKHPDKTYFVARNKYFDYPVSKVLERVPVAEKRYDARVLEPSPTVTTQLTHITGAIRDAEHDLLEYLYDASGYRGKRKILSAVDEWGGTITLNGDFVFLVVEWLQKSGF